MALTAAELGLSNDDWTTLATSLQHASFALDLYKWQPEFVASGDFEVFFPDFDAIAYLNDFAQANAYTVSNSTGIFVGYVPPVSLKVGRPLSLATDGSALSVFAITPTGIALNTYNGSTWSGYAGIVTDSTVIYAAATSPTCVHFLTFDASHHYTQFHVADYAGSWTVTDSDLYWAYQVNSFAAKRLNGVDVLCIASDMPGIQSVQVVGTAVSKKILPSGGLFVFTYQYATWSDHIEIDHIDQWSAFRYRSRVCLSVIGTKLWLTCYSSEGTVDHPILGYRVYASGDGTHWSRGELLPLPVESTEGVVLVQTGTSLRAVTYSQVYTAPMTLWFGASHTSMHLSLVGKVLDIQVDRQELQQVSIAVDDRQQWFSSTDFASGKTIAAVLKTGYAGINVQTGIFEIDTVEVIRDDPKRVIQLQGRDRMAWMTGKSQSEQFENWSPQIIGVDEYVDNTGTGYGGMSYTAETENGGFKAAEGSLQLISSNTEGMAYATWLNDNWNGAVEEFVSLATLGNAEYIGLVFRSPDKDNGFFYYYDQASDKLKLDRRIAASVTNLWQSSAKGWSGSLTGRFLRVEYRYCRVIVYSSNDPSGGGITWTLEHSLLVDGQVTPASPLVQSGYVGSFGRGFSNLDLSAPALGVFPEGVLPDNYTDYVPEASVTPEPIPIMAYDFISAIGITPISAGTDCGVVSAGTFDTGGDGLNTPNSLKRPINNSNQGCDQNSFNVAPPVGDTWISVTEVRFHMKLDFPDGGPAGNNWYTVSAKVYGPLDPSGTIVYSHLYIDTYGLQMAYAEVIVPINYVHQVTSIDILNVWHHNGVPFDNAPGSYLANMTVYGLVTH